MQGYLKRDLESKIEQYRRIFPVVAIIGPRQCGKSSLARFIQSSIAQSIYLDLENQDDINKITVDPGLFFDQNVDKTIFLDEIQRAPELFRSLRVVCDKYQKNGWIIILGSSSPDLLQQSSESLAGRIGFLELTPFLINEVNSLEDFSIFNHWLKGGFPRSYLLPEKESFTWLGNFIRTYLERDIPQLGKNYPSETLRRLIQMLAYSHGNVVNWSKIGDSLGISNHTVQSYTILLEKTFLLRILRPYSANIKKRLIKSPKLYFRDSGILHQLLRINSFNDLMGNQMYGSSWEGYAMENIISSTDGFETSFYRTASGLEIDLLLQRGSVKLAVEFKATRAPVPGKGFYEAIEDTGVSEAWIICPIDEKYLIRPNVTVSGLYQFIEYLRTL